MKYHERLIWKIILIWLHWRASGRRGWSDVRALALLWTIVLVSSLPLLVWPVVWDPDVTLAYLPFKTAGADMFRRGQLPFWTPDMGLGYPLLADGEGALLYPDILLFLLLPALTAFVTSLVMHALVASGFCYAFCRRIGLSPAAAVVSSLVFTYAGPVLQNLGSPHMTVASWWPALLLAVEGMLAATVVQARSRWLVFGVVVVALMHLAGNPQVTALGCLLAGAYALFRSWALPWRARSVGLAGCGLMVLLGTGVAAPQILAVLELADRSVRSGGTGAQAGLGSLFPPAVIELVAPNWRFAAALRVQSPNGYVGMAALALGLLALVYRRPGARFWAAVAVMTILLAFGRFTPLLGIVSQLPGFEYLRVPARYLYITVTALAVLAGMGLDQVLAAVRAGRATQGLVRAGIVLGGVVLAIDLSTWVAFRLAPDAVYTAVTTLTGTGLGKRASESEFFTAALQATSPADPLLWLPLFGLVGIAALVAALKRDWRRATLVAVAVVACEALLIGGPFWRTLDASSADPFPYRRPATVEAIQRLGAGRTYSFGEPVQLALAGHHDVLPANANLMYRVPSIGLYAVFGSPRYGAFLDPLGAVNLSYGADPPTKEDVTANRRLLDLLGVSFVLSRVPLDGFDLADRVEDVYIYRNPTAFPRAWVVGHVQLHADDPPADLKAPDLDLRQVALVDDPGIINQGQSGPARVLQDGGSRMEVAAAGPGLLVLADRWAPGWTATVDGVPTAVLRVNGILRGIPLPPGAHQITFVYYPAAFWRGVTIALGAVAILIVVVAVVQIRRASRQRFAPSAEANRARPAARALAQGVSEEPVHAIRPSPRH